MILGIEKKTTTNSFIWFGALGTEWADFWESDSWVFQPQK